LNALLGLVTLAASGENGGVSVAFFALWRFLQQRQLTGTIRPQRAELHPSIRHPRCFESSFPDLVRTADRLGSQIGCPLCARSDAGNRAPLRCLDEIVALVGVIEATPRGPIATSLLRLESNSGCDRAGARARARSCCSRRARLDRPRPRQKTGRAWPRSSRMHYASLRRVPPIVIFFFPREPSLYFRRP